MRVSYPIAGLGFGFLFMAQSFEPPGGQGAGSASTLRRQADLFAYPARLDLVSPCAIWTDLNGLSVTSALLAPFSRLVFDDRPPDPDASFPVRQVDQVGPASYAR